MKTRQELNDEMVNKAIEQINQSLPFGEVVEFAKQASKAIKDFGDTLYRVVGDVAPLVELCLSYWPDESDCKNYARWYNARHAGRRVSWLRLNKIQRAQAFTMFHD